MESRKSKRLMQMGGPLAQALALFRPKLSKIFFKSLLFFVRSGKINSPRDRQKTPGAKAWRLESIIWSEYFLP
jgi:hypothetical protein